MDLFEAIESQQQNKQFIGKPVSYEKLAILARAGCYASTAGGLPHTNFILINNARTIDEIAGCTSGQDWVREAGGIIAVVCQKDLLNDWYGERALKEGEKDVASETQNILLASYALNLAACCVTEFNTSKVEQLLNPFAKQKFQRGSTELLEVIAIGQPLAAPPKRRPIELQNRVWFEKQEERLRYRHLVRGQYFEALKKIGYNMQKRARGTYKQLRTAVKKLLKQ